LKIRAASSTVNSSSLVTVAIVIVTILSGVTVIASSGILNIPESSSASGNNYSIPNSSQNFTLTLSTSGSGVTFPSNGTYNIGFGVTQNFIAESSEGWFFDRWIIDGQVSNLTSSLSVLMDRDHTVQAVFKPITYEIKVNTIGMGNVTVIHFSSSDESISTIKLVATPLDGWIFDHYEGFITASSNPLTVTLREDSIITAVFKPKPILIPTFSLNISKIGSGTGFITVSPPGGVYTSGTFLTITATPDINSSFSGWSGFSTGSNNTLSFSIRENCTVAAKFDKDTYNLVTTVTPSEGGTVERSSEGPYLLDDVVSLTATTKQGYHFVGWSGDIVSTENPLTLKMNDSKTLIATFIKTSVVMASNSLTLNVDVSPPSGGVVTTSSNAPYHREDIVILNAIPSPGYIFTGWSGGVSGSSSTVTVTMDSSKSVTATFTQITSYTITASAGSGGVISPSGAVSVSPGSSQVFSITANTGYQVSGVLVDGSSVGVVSSYTFSNVQAVHTIAASFTQIMYTLTTVTVGQGSVSRSPNQSSYASGSSVKLTANVPAGWVFGGWSGGVSGSSSTVTVTMDSSKSVTATFTQIASYTITASAGSGGVISPSGAVSVSPGSSQVFSITANTGYQVSGVLVDGSSVGVVSSYTFSNVQAVHTIAASFTPITNTSKVNQIKLTINHNLVTSNLVDFPIMIHLSSSSGTSSTNTQSIFNVVNYDNRKKISVVASDGVTECFVEIENWDSSLQEATLWAKVPSISSTIDTVLYLNYGLMFDNTDYVGDTIDLTTPSVWSNGYVGVYHLSESAAGIVGEYKDSSSQRNHGTGGANVNNVVSSTKVPGRVIGPMGYCANFDGSNDVIRIPDNPKYSIINNAGHQLTVSFWLSWDNLNINSKGWISPVGKGDYTVAVPNAKHEYKFNFYADNLAEYPTDRRQRRSFYTVDKDSGLGSGDYAQPGYNYAGEIPYWSVGSWTNICGQINGDYVSMYNGPGILGHAPVNYALGQGASGNIIDLQDTNSAFWLGSYGDSSSTSHYLDGRIDEVRISSVARSVAWMKADYYSQLDGLMTYLVVN
jgi:uncharacterized repeat protein (TIGR02543 family)